jgi:hypothetical protein
MAMQQEFAIHKKKVSSRIYQAIPTNKLRFSPEFGKAIQTITVPHNTQVILDKGSCQEDVITLDINSSMAWRDFTGKVQDRNTQVSFNSTSTVPPPKLFQQQRGGISTKNEKDMEDFRKFGKQGHLRVGKEEATKAQRLPFQTNSRSTLSTSTSWDDKEISKEPSGGRGQFGHKAPFAKYAFGNEPRTERVFKQAPTTFRKRIVDPYATMSEDDKDYEKVEHHHNGGGSKLIGSVTSLYEELAAKREELKTAEKHGAVHLVDIPERLRAILFPDNEDDEEDLRKNPQNSVATHHKNKGTSSSSRIMNYNIK